MDDFNLVIFYLLNFAWKVDRLHSPLLLVFKPASAYTFGTRPIILKPTKLNDFFGKTVNCLKKKELWKKFCQGNVWTVLELLEISPFEVDIFQ